MQTATMNAIESEAGVIATLIHSPDFVFHSENLLPNHFTDTENQYVFTAICELAKKGIKTIDSYNIIESLNSSETTRNYTECLTVEKLQEFIDMSDVLARNSLEEYKMLVDNVLNAAFRRDLFQKLKECQALCVNGTEKDIEQQVYKKIDEVITSYSTTEEIPRYGEVVDKYWNEIQARQGEGYAGIPFKFPLLNEYVTIEKGELVVFGAKQKTGKSIMLLNCAVSALKDNHSILYIDSELSSRLFTARLLAHLSGVTYLNLTHGNYNKEEEKRIKECIEWLKTRKFCHLYMPFFDKASIYTAVKRANHVEPIDILIVDYFKANGSVVDQWQTYAEMGACVDLIKNEIAGSMNIAAIGAAQATEYGKLADSAKIARNASTVIMLSDKTPEEIAEDGEECGNKKMTVLFNRNGMQHAQGEWIDLAFDGNHISYEQAPKQHIPKSPF